MTILSIPRAGHMARCEHCGNLYEVRSAHESIESQALRRLAPLLVGAHEDCWRFFRAVWAPSPGYASAKRLAADLAVLPSSLLSRFFRLGLPSPKQYLQEALLVRAARMLENPSVSVVRVARELECSSAQSFSRTVRASTGMSPAVFRQHFDGTQRLDVFAEALVMPFRQQLLALRPLTENAIVPSQLQQARSA